MLTALCEWTRDALQVLEIEAADASGHPKVRILSPPLQALLPPPPPVGALRSHYPIEAALALLKAAACSVQRGKSSCHVASAYGTHHVSSCRACTGAVMLLGACCQKAVGRFEEVVFHQGPHDTGKKYMKGRHLCCPLPKCSHIQPAKDQKTDRSLLPACISPTEATPLAG